MDIYSVDLFQIIYEAEELWQEECSSSGDETATCQQPTTSAAALTATNCTSRSWAAASSYSNCNTCCLTAAGAAEAGQLPSTN
jgi:hypothetical protein